MTGFLATRPLSDEKPPHFFFVLNIIICCPSNICPRAVEIRGHDARKPVFWFSDKVSLKPVSSA